ncbi:PorT family protein [Crocinitomicaceae bacterium]|nr:PorT family protein [Crocinitomicaceae bacterium]
MKNIFKSIFCLFIALPFYSAAQTAADKKVQAGLTFNAGANFLSPSSSRIKINGAGSIVSVGLNLHSAFKSSPNLAIATGLEFDFGKNKFSLNDSTRADYDDGEYLTKEQAETYDNDNDITTNYLTYNIESRIVSTTKLTIPLMLLFRTNFIGDFRYFGKFGIRNTFLLSHSIEDSGGQLGGNNDNNILMSSPGEMFLYNGSIGLTAGAEWNFVGSTCLVLEAGYYYGITPYFLDRKDDNKTMYNVGTELIFPPSRSYYSASARQNQLIFKLSILF